MKETELYPLIKAFWEGQGFEVKAEVGPADVVAIRGDKIIITELKVRFSLALFHQAVDRLSMCSNVYIAVARGAGAAWRKSLTSNRRLARQLGIGLLAVDLSAGFVTLVCEAKPPPVRRRSPKAQLLASEFERRRGDPNIGGTNGRRVTAYRQEAELCAAFLMVEGDAKGSLVAAKTGVARATTIMRDNYYGWFERVKTGVYKLSETYRREHESGAEE